MPVVNSGQPSTVSDRVLPGTSRFATPTSPAEAPPHGGRAQHNLPVQATPFVGREAELAELDRLLSHPGVRLVTVLGGGGGPRFLLDMPISALLLNVLHEHGHESDTR